MDPMGREDMGELVAALSGNWGVKVSGVPSDWEVVRAALEARIHDLLQRNPQKLATAMYILDVREKDFAAAMEQPTMEDRAHALSCVVMERETEKIRTRRQYAHRHLE